MEMPQRLVLQGWPEPGDVIAAKVLDHAGTVVGMVPEPANATDVEALRDAIVAAALMADFGEIVLAGVAFSPHLGGDAIGFT